MATKAEERAYAAKLREISRSLGRLERATLEQSIRLLRSVRDQVAGQLTGTEFSQFRVAEQQRAIDDIIASYESQIRALANGSTRQAFNLGERSAVEPLQAAGVKMAFFRPSEAQVNIIAQFSADLIGGKIAPDLRHAINRSIQMNALGGNSTLDAMRDINDALFKSQRPPSPTTQRPTKGVTYEAERILRTETNRAFNLAAHAQMEQHAKDIPGLRKQWMATADGRTRISHLLTHGQVVPVDEPFSVNGSELMFPGDPIGPASETINCRCTVATVIPELEDTSLASDKRIAAELEKRTSGSSTRR